MIGHSHETDDSLGGEHRHPCGGTPEQVRCDRCRPIKAINHYGDEILKVHEVTGVS